MLFEQFNLSFFAFCFSFLFEEKVNLSTVAAFIIMRAYNFEILALRNDYFNQFSLQSNWFHRVLRWGTHNNRFVKLVHLWKVFRNLRKQGKQNDTRAPHLDNDACSDSIGSILLQQNHCNFSSRSSTFCGLCEHDLQKGLCFSTRLTLDRQTWVLMDLRSQWMKGRV